MTTVAKYVELWTRPKPQRGSYCTPTLLDEPAHNKNVPRAKALRFHAGTGAGRAIGTGLNVKAIRKAPSPMIHEPI